MTASEEHLDFDQDATQGGGGERHRDDPRTGYFARGQITLLVLHGRDFDDWQNWLNGLADKWLRDVITRRGIRALLSPLLFNPEDKKSFITTFPEQEGNQVQSLLHLQLAPADERFGDAARWKDADDILVEIINTLNERAIKEKENEFEGVIVQSAAPNWLLASATHTLTHGGPGALPVEPNGPVTKDDYTFDTSKVDSLSQCHGKRDVTVVIFDSVPPPPKGVAAGRILNGIYDGFPNHPIVGKWTAAGAPSKLTIKRASETGIYVPPVVAPKGAYYATAYDQVNMSDHGSFIAGTVTTLASGAEIVLVEALNHYGVGSTNVFAECLNKLAAGKIVNIPARNENANWSLIINCSLTIDIPEADEAGNIVLEQHDHHGNVLRKLVLKDQKAKSLLLAPARAALDHFNRFFRGYDVQIVAAAGNDSEQGQTPRPSAYPAAFTEVLGVGAMEDDVKRAYYSNKADNPTSSGVMVPGGKASPKRGVTDTRIRWNKSDNHYGILGLYVGKISSKGPDGEPGPEAPSATGWARWAGTSFSAGVVSGVLAYAALMGCKVSINAPDGFYQRLIHDANTKHTGEGEPILPVKQGR